MGQPSIGLAKRLTRRTRQERSPRFELRLGDELIGLQCALADESYAPGRYVSFHIHEPKKRLISAAPSRDRVVHHVSRNVAGPHFERLFHPRSNANRAGRSIAAGKYESPSPLEPAGIRGGG